MTIRMIGVSNTIRMSDVQTMGGPAQQDQFIAEAAKHLTRELRDFVKDTRPRSDFIFEVQGPFDDPIQGWVYVHTLAANFETNDLPTESGAWRAWTDSDGDGTAIMEAIKATRPTTEDPDV